MAKRSNTAGFRHRGQLPTKGTWQFSVRPAPAWLGSSAEKLRRPILMIAVDEKSHQVLGTHMTEQRPAPIEVGLMIKSLLDNLHEEGIESRPERIVLDDQELVKELRPVLRDDGVSVDYRESLPLIDEITHALGEHLAQGPVLRGLLTMPGITPELLRAFYKQAATYYRAAPWLAVNDRQPIEVRFPPTGMPRFAVVMGNGKESYGLASYESVDDLSLIYAGMSPTEAVGHFGWTSLMYGPENDIPFEDVDAIARHKFEIAGPNAYPFTLKVDDVDLAPVTYNVSDLFWMMAALEGVRRFVEEELAPGAAEDGGRERTYTLTGALAGQQILLRYPVEIPDMPAILEETADALMDSIFDFIDEWEWYEDEPSEQFAVEMAGYMFGFFQNEMMNGLSASTMQKHVDNAWHIGRFVLESGKYKRFSPDIFQSKPQFLTKFKREVSSAKTTVAAYERTWRKLAKFADFAPTISYPPPKMDTPIEEQYPFLAGDDSISG